MALVDSTNPMQGVSGPGPFSKRVDLEYQSQAYGDGKEYKALKAGAPLETSPNVPGSNRTTLDVSSVGTATTPIGLFDKSQWTDVPISDGVDIGAGRGSSALMMNQPTGKISDALAALLPYDTTGEITILYQNAIARGQ